MRPKQKKNDNQREDGYIKAMHPVYDHGLLCTDEGMRAAFRRLEKQCHSRADLTSEMRYLLANPETLALIFSGM